MFTMSLTMPGDVRVDQRWKYRAPNPYTLEEAMERIDQAGAWVILKHTELDPEYKALMDAIMSEVERISGRELRQTHQKPRGPDYGYLARPHHSLSF